MNKIKYILTYTISLFFITFSVFCGVFLFNCYNFITNIKTNINSNQHQIISINKENKEKANNNNEKAFVVKCLNFLISNKII